MSRHTLEPGYQLHWYVIREILGQGGFGITYLADDTNLNQKVAIKEYLPTELAVREQDDSVHPVSGEHGEQFKWGLERFIREAQTLAQFKHNNIVRVLTVFSDNNTAYMVMEYEEGQALHELLKQKKTLPEQEQLAILGPLLDGLDKVHAMGFIHRDVKPANIYIRSDGSPVLLDFGSARQALGEQTQTLTTMVSPGYAPFEQYVSKSDKQGPWTDMYGLAATLYRASIGRSPPNAVDRSESILHNGQDLLVPASVVKPEGYSEHFLQAIDHALGFKAEDRPQSVLEWRSEFDGLNQSQGETVATKEFANGAADESDSSGDSERKTFQVSNNETAASAAPTELPVPRPTFFRRLFNLSKKILKWAAILFVVLVLLSLCDDKNKKKEQSLEESAKTESSESMPEVDQDSIEATVVPDTPELSTESDAESVSRDIDDIIRTLLASADEDIRALRLTSPNGNNAVEKFYQVLQMEPQNQLARDGLSRVSETYLQLMDRAIENKQFPKAQQYLSKASHVDPGNAGLSAARDRLQSAINEQRSAERKLEEKKNKQELISQESIEKKSENTSLMTESERKTLERIREQLSKDPDNKRAQRQAKRLAKNFEKKVKKALEEQQFDLAENYVLEAIKIAPENKGLKEAVKKIQEIRKQTGL